MCNSLFAFYALKMEMHKTLQFSKVYTLVDVTLMLHNCEQICVIYCVDVWFLMCCIVTSPNETIDKQLI